MRTWNIDPVHSEIAFKTKHLMISTVRGTFGSFEGNITAENDAFENASIAFHADVTSVDTKNEHRDTHLKNADIFDAEQFPKFSFISSSVIMNGADMKIIGDLTLKGVTKQVELDATFNGIAKGVTGARVAAFDLSGKISRQDFGVTWNAALETGGVAVGDIVQIEATIEAVEA